MSGKLLKELSQLGSLQKNSKNLYQSAEKVLLLAFDHPKPLFVGTDRKEIEPLVERAIPLLRESFIRLNIRLEPELLEIAQRYRSGLQYIVDEFGPSGESKHIEFYDRLRSFLDGPVLSVEDYIKNCKELQIEPEGSYINKPVVTAEHISQIPDTHWWWFVEPLSEPQKEEEQEQEL